MGEEELGNRYSEEGDSNLAEECFKNRGIWESTIIILNKRLKGGKQWTYQL